MKNPMTAAEIGSTVDNAAIPPLETEEEEEEEDGDDEGAGADGIVGVYDVVCIHVFLS